MAALTVNAITDPLGNTPIEVDTTADLTACSGTSDTFANDGKTIIFIFNSDVGAHTVTFTNQSNKYGRTGTNLAKSVGASTLEQAGPFPKDAFNDSSGNVTVSCSDTAVKYYVLQLP